MSATRSWITGWTLLLSLTGLSAGPKEANLQVEVGVYNHSAVPARMLARAEHEAGGIFERAGVATIWLHCPLTAQEALHNSGCAQGRNPRLMLRLLSNSMTENLQLKSEIFGAARLADNQDFAEVADIYADRTRELAKGFEFDVILGRVIAHELGHLLLGKGSHSAAGIMHTPWRARDLESTSEGAKSFLTTENKRIRAQILARSAKKQSAVIRQAAAAAIAGDLKLTVVIYN